MPLGPRRGEGFQPEPCSEDPGWRVHQLRVALAFGRDRHAHQRYHREQNVGLDVLPLPGPECRQPGVILQPANHSLHTRPHGPLQPLLNRLKDVRFLHVEFDAVVRQELLGEPGQRLVRRVDLVAVLLEELLDGLFESLPYCTSVV